MSRLTNQLLLPALLVALAGVALAAPPDEAAELRYAAMLEREYGPLGRTTEQILAREASHEPATVVGALLYRIRAKPEERRSAVERRLVAAREVIEEVDAGGFQGYFTGAAGDHAALALQAFRDMGAAGLAKLLQRAMAVFPQGRPPPQAAQRQSLLQRSGARALSVWSSCDDELYVKGEEFAALALAYAKKHRAQIVLP